MKYSRENVDAAKASLARAETNAENAVRALEQERSAAKELDEAATMALGEVERLAADAARLEKALAEQTALTDEARVDLEMTREELAEAPAVAALTAANLLSIGSAVEQRFEKLKGALDT